jgi:hypothetical protein
MNQGEDAPNTQAPHTKRARASNKDSDDSSEGLNEETQVINAGHHFVMLCSPWLRRQDIFKVEYNPDFDEEERFENGDNMNQGQLQEIMKVLPVGARSSEQMSEPWIARVVSQ